MTLLVVLYNSSIPTSLIIIWLHFFVVLMSTCSAARLLLLIVLPAASDGFVTPHALPRHAPVLRSKHVFAAAAGDSTDKFWEPWRMHDAFNLAVLPVATAWTGAALFSAGLNVPLARFFGAYIAIDAAWIALQPDIVGAPRVLIWHHLVTLLLVWHTLTCVPHQHFVSWMTVVEFNTFFLILRRHVRHPLIDLAFNLSWIAIRVIWFPIVAVYLTFFIGGWPGGWQGSVRHALVGICTSSLALLQLRWTRDALMKKKSDDGVGDGADGDNAEKKEGFL